MSSDSRPTVAYWHLWTDSDGISHQTRCTMTEFERASIQPGAAAQWIGAKTSEGATVFATVLPVGWKGEIYQDSVALGPSATTEVKFADIQPE